MNKKSNHKAIIESRIHNTFINDIDVGVFLYA